MALTPSTMLELGTDAPDFSLMDVVTGQRLSLSDFEGDRALLVAFWCNHCPYVLHIQEGFVDFARDYADRELAIVAISSNDVDAYPQDGPGPMKELANRAAYPFPYLFDETQEVAHAYRAACTPDFFLFNEDRKLVYRGQFDGSRPSTGVPVTGDEMRRAVDAVLGGETPSEAQTPSMGCNIKWKPGNEPSWFG